MPETAVATGMTELELLHFFLEKLISRGEKAMPFDEAMAQFKRYRVWLDRMREELRPAAEELDRGGGKETRFRRVA